MKGMLKKILLLATILFSFGTILMAQVPDDLITCFKKGNAVDLAKYFSANIELTVLDQDDVYSKAQAQQIISNFFSQNKAEDFSIIHEPGNESSKFVIGNLKTDKESFRVSFLLKSEEDKAYIHLLRIEKQ